MTFCVTFWHKIAYFYAFGPKRSIYHTFTYKNIRNSELSSVNRGVATLNAISGHDFHLPLEGNSKFIRPPKIIFASFIISTPLLNQSLNQNDPILSSDKFSFYLVSKNLHLTLKNRSEYTGDLISAFLCEPQKTCECGENPLHATLTFAILLATYERVSKRVFKLVSKIDFILLTLSC